MANSMQLYTASWNTLRGKLWDPEKLPAASRSATGSDLGMCSHDTQRRQKRPIFPKFVNRMQLTSSKNGEKISKNFFEASRLVARGIWESNCVAIKRTLGSLWNRMECLYLTIMVMAVIENKEWKKAKIDKHINYVSNHRIPLRTLWWEDWNTAANFAYLKSISFWALY